jgi:hypothetical protein
MSKRVSKLQENHEHMILTTMLLALCLFAAFSGSSARAGDVIKYRNENGSIGFAEDVTQVPRTATVLPPPDLSKSRFVNERQQDNDGGQQDSYPEAGRLLSQRENYEKMQAWERKMKERGRLSRMRGDLRRAMRQELRAQEFEQLTVETYQREQASIRGEAEREEAAAEGMRCLPGTAGRPDDCRARTAAKVKAAETTRQVPDKLKDVDERCMNDPECAPRSIMKDASSRTGP